MIDNCVGLSFFSTNFKVHTPLATGANGDHGVKVKTTKIMQTGRLIGVLCLDLFGFFSNASDVANSWCK